MYKNNPTYSFLHSFILARIHIFIYPLNSHLLGSLLLLKQRALLFVCDFSQELIIKGGFLVYIFKINNGFF